MTLQEYLRVFTRRWWLLLALAFLGAASAYGASKLQEPLYRSTIKLYVAPSRPDYGGVLVIKDIIRQYSQILQSDRILQQVIEQMRLDVKPEVLRSRLHSSGTPDNQALLLSVDDRDPNQAPRIAKALALAFQQDHRLRMQQVERRDQIDLLLYDEPTPAALVQPKTRLNVIAGAILGLLVGALAAFVLEYLDDTLKTQEDVQRVLGTLVLGTIPALEAGSDALSTPPERIPVHAESGRRNP
jgi:capsular polysaccharide biosynthesis protein